MQEYEVNPPVDFSGTDALDVVSRLEMRRSDLIKAGQNPDEIMKANSNGVLDLIERKHDNNRKSMIIDPNDFSGSFGYKERPIALSYNMLHNMSKVPVVNTIIKTRINQVAAFAEPQTDRYQVGFVVRKKRRQGDKVTKMTRKELKEANRITDFILNCGQGFSFDGDQDFDTFVRKVIRDSLVYDQMTFETIYDRRGVPYAFYSVDAATIRMAESLDDQNLIDKNNIWHMSQTAGNLPEMLRKTVKGYHPKYVQIHNNAPIASFYPWELCFGVRNPMTSIYTHGYGTSELQDLVTTITALVWGEEYNRRFFKQGSIPKGIIKVSGQINDVKLQEFKREWNATMRGVYNAWKTPIMEAEKMEWVDIQKSNRDMEYHSWIEFLIKIACAMYSIDPSEINFDISSGGASGKSTFEGNNNERVKYSRDKGLYPLLKFLAAKLNRSLITPINPEYELVFVGMNSLGQTEELDMTVKKVTNYMTVDEVRAEQGLEPLPNGEGSIILNAVFASARMAEQQQSMMGGALGQGGMNPQVGDEEDEENPFDMKDFNDEEETQKGEDPIVKAFQEYYEKTIVS